MIKKTKDYSMFKKHASNRNMADSNLQRIIKSIQLKNLLEFRPILVDAEYNVIDGQHRLEAAKILGVEIYYDVHKESEVKDMFLLNANQRKWYPEDYLNFYCNEGNQNYIKLRDFLKRKGLNLAQGNKLLAKYNVGTDKLKQTQRNIKFNNGEYIFPTPAQVFEAEEMLDKINEIISYTQQKLAGQNLFLTSQKFLLSLTEFFLIYPVDFNDFMKKLPFKLEMIRPCAQRSQYLQIFKDIYNFRNQNPIHD